MIGRFTDGRLTRELQIHVSARPPVYVVFFVFRLAVLASLLLNHGNGCTSTKVVPLYAVLMLAEGISK